jgi:DNA-binding CsgD family transcriptional regulator
MENTEDTIRELSLLEQVERDPDINQATLATQLGVAVGTVNWHLKRLVSKTRQRVKEHLIEIRRAGYDRVRIAGTGDVADICRLTCLEQGLTVTEDEKVPALYVDGFKVQLFI